ncbi:MULTISPECIES: formate dehydrogenase accessory sulfurtransferase FdhD [Tenacibaculum]|uniref:formate dehydrogenase accessory sulfurtransferase FdhD n=1 Tax=Tenacibaculum TaxID=104267 RepID=UPI001F0A4925|nr:MULTISPECIES: formate dehydrogenase accessory sulfurtransferase FdhD [Tenacibaculum]MCH3882583.1 formate dehydrogenase accessory sulfurtransferase FdhD [Tenacibaculum aquimarinum]MDO6600610.1 formate dehydrogenase accessory sulfurtransferase FdhD [Tenacibaculum sp. 1_MG-2023]
MQTTTYQAIKINAQEASKIDDTLVIEAPLQININNEAYTVVMRTPNNDIELIRGLLFAEDIYKNKESFSTEIIEEKEDFSTIINVSIPKEKLGKGYLNKRTLLSVSSCGICGKKELSDIEVSGNKLANTTSFFQTEIKQMFLKMKELQEAFHFSGGSHAAAIFNKNKELLSIKEDIGRHNAVDKSIGDLLLNNKLNEAKILLVSGRVSYEIVSKAFFAKIPIIVAVSACSSLAVDFAKEFGICLIGFSRNDKMTIYSNPQYIQYER